MLLQVRVEMAKQFIAVNHLRKQKPKVKVEPVPSFNFTVQFCYADERDIKSQNVNGVVYAPYLPPMMSKQMHRSKEYQVKKQMKHIHDEMCGCKKFCIMKTSHDITVSELYLSFWSVLCEQAELFKFQVSFNDECANIFQYQENKEQLCTQ